MIMDNNEYILIYVLYFWDMLPFQSRMICPFWHSSQKYLCMCGMWFWWHSFKACFLLGTDGILSCIIVGINHHLPTGMVPNMHRHTGMSVEHSQYSNGWSPGRERVQNRLQPSARSLVAEHATPSPSMAGIQPPRRSY